ncbi:MULTISPECIES: acyltransferase family protein [unclassified Bradyrhizobium]|uniref:acyltransferase family protein n=1 Tax=unclassified Bradyrhizobium TaxID=2631580 RepID=UPI0028E3A22A|nr:MULTISPECIES: SGNH hydrolase domain-containing protein [unclassified Bradyrhizobium]
MSVAVRLEYRPDIDCLRAFAVISVIGFHYEVPGFGGGFVGVDVFFVISGYVISRLIWAGLATDSFSFLTFYERRARRLLPALYLLILVTGIAGYVLVPPSDYRMFFGSAISTLLFSSNIFFWMETGYFDLPTMGKVLIHTWSLSVEEQFYFLFPVITWLWSKLFRDPASRSSLALVIAGTMALCIVDELLIKNSASAAFYLAPLRAWEFLIGSIAFFLHRWSPVGFSARCAHGLMGLALMLIPVVMFRPETRFPGLHALIPCLGAALFIIAFNQDDGRPRLPFENAGAFVGRLSYALYLWHWPVFVLGRAALPLDVASSNAGTMALLVCSVLLAYLSHIAVERPIRARIAWNGLRTSGLIAGTAAVLMAVGVHGFSHEGYAGRFPASQERMLRYNAQAVAPFYRTHSCFLQPDEPLSHYDSGACLTPAADRRNILLAGDSIAAHYGWGLRDYLPAAYHLMQLTSAACAPFVELRQEFSQSCNDANRLLREEIRARRPAAVIVSGNWRVYVDVYGQSAAPGFDGYLGALLKEAEDAGIPVLLLGPSLEFPAPLAQTLFNYERMHLPVANSLTPVEASFKADERLREIARSHPGVQYVSVLDAICSLRACPTRADPETPITWDIIHLTPEGSKFVVSKLKPQLDAFLSRLALPSEAKLKELVAGRSTRPRDASSQVQ